MNIEKNTVLDLWNAFADVPSEEDGNGGILIEEPFMGWPAGTDVQVVWRWFDEAYEKHGGIAELLYGNLEPERKFQVKTPDGIIECYSKHEGKDCGDDYPGVFIDIRTTPEQLAGKAMGDLACCVEYDSGNKRLQTVCYSDLSDDSPTFGEVVDDGISIIGGYGESVKL